MVSQVATVMAALIFLILKEIGSAKNIYKDMIWILMLITTVITLISGISYLVKNKGVYLNAKAG